MRSEGDRRGLKALITTPEGRAAANASFAVFNSWTVFSNSMVFSCQIPFFQQAMILPEKSVDDDQAERDQKQITHNFQPSIFAGHMPFPLLTANSFPKRP